MNQEEIKYRIIRDEIVFTTSRSGGPGGQNVNKVNTKVELRFNIRTSASFSDHEKELIEDALQRRINKEGELIITSQSERTQLQNRNKAEELFFRLLAKALTPVKIRKATKPTETSRKVRLESKKRKGITKTLRKKTGLLNTE